MENFREFIKEVEASKEHADKFYINENMEAGKRLFSSLMDVERKCKAAREELSNQRAFIRNQRKDGNQSMH